MTTSVMEERIDFKITYEYDVKSECNVVSALVKKYSPVDRGFSVNLEHATH